MLLDINASVGHWPFQQVRYNTCDSLLGRMKEFGVDVSVISTMNGIFYKNTQKANEELHSWINAERRFKERFIPFAVINPFYAGWKHDLEVSIKKMGMKGVHLFPKYHDYPMDAPEHIELVKRARDYGIPVAYKIRVVDSRSRSWLDINYVAQTKKPEWNVKDIVPIIKAVPDAKYMILNVANGITVNNEKEMELLKKADLVFDTSGRTINRLPELLDVFGEKKFAFGTHTPILDYLTGLLRIEAMRQNEADKEAKELMRHKNAERILGI
jgi:predicted TIM-barrel fold metal-dependent hydrolase